MLDKMELSQENIGKLSDQFNYSDHFKTVVAPRLQSLLYVKEVFKDSDLLEWNIIYSATNRSSNCVRLSLVDPNKKFHFFYEIPLLQKFELKLFLGDNTFNFFEAYPLLIDKKVINEDEYKTSATLNTLPHLQLAPYTRTFDRQLLTASQLPDRDIIQSSTTYKAIGEASNKFTSSLYKIINGEWML